MNTACKRAFLTKSQLQTAPEEVKRQSRRDHCERAISTCEKADKHHEEQSIRCERAGDTDGTWFHMASRRHVGRMLKFWRAELAKLSE